MEEDNREKKASKKISGDPFVQTNEKYQYTSVSASRNGNEDSIGIPTTSFRWSNTYLIWEMSWFGNNVCYHVSAWSYPTANAKRRGIVAC
jgi:hypothetical protein